MYDCISFLGTINAIGGVAWQNLSKVIGLWNVQLTNRQFVFFFVGPVQDVFQILAEQLL